MTKYTVHIYREMKLSFPGIEAQTHTEAAAIASKMDTGEAEDVEDCDGEDLGALVDVVGDEDFANSQLIDFEPQLERKRAADLLAFAARIARMTQDGEEVDGKGFVMENDDAVTTLNELIDEASSLVKEV